MAFPALLTRWSDHASLGLIKQYSRRGGPAGCGTRTSISKVSVLTTTGEAFVSYVERGGFDVSPRSLAVRLGLGAIDTVRCPSQGSTGALPFSRRGALL